ncbi:hypothetical protein BGAL_0065g00290 [Botrytis galanthina]|uniref:Uncharacterized protein n=1 Tax=Botrytis galanthina TaxID=278940 RepID=A0A4S8R5Q5_9HELO|nr:hypothetical protein BGAL_0065g00290 [Botrytis galanthina]
MKDDKQENYQDPNPSPSSVKHGVSEPLICDTITMQISLGRYVHSPSTGRKESKNVGGIGW